MYKICAKERINTSDQNLKYCGTFPLLVDAPKVLVPKERRVVQEGGNFGRNSMQQINANKEKGKMLDISGYAMCGKRFRTIA